MHAQDTVCFNRTVEDASLLNYISMDLPFTTDEVITNIQYDAKNLQWKFSMLITFWLIE